VLLTAFSLYFISVSYNRDVSPPSWFCLKRMCYNCNRFCSKSFHNKPNHYQPTQTSLGLWSNQPLVNWAINSNQLMCDLHSVTLSEVSPLSLSNYLWQLAEKITSKNTSAKYQHNIPVKNSWISVSSTRSEELRTKIYVVATTFTVFLLLLLISHIISLLLTVEPGKKTKRSKSLLSGTVQKACLRLNTECHSHTRD